MKRRPNPAKSDHENPVWTADDFRRAKPAAEVLSSLFGTRVAAQMLKTRGRSKTGLS